MRCEAPAGVAHEPELVQLTAQGEQDREPEERGERVALRRDVVQRQHVGHQQQAEPGEGDARHVQLQRIGEDPPGDHQRERHRGDPLFPRQRSQRRKRLPRGQRGFRRLAHAGRKDPRDDPWQQQDRGQRRHRGHDEPLAEADLQPELPHDLDADRVGGRGRHPEGGRDREARHCAEHQVRAQPATLGIVGPRAGSLRHRQHDREQHAAASGVARERRRDDRVREHDAVREAQR